MANPMYSWNPTDVLGADAGPAVNDVYGKLYAYLLTIFRAFYRHLSVLSINVDMLCADVSELPLYINERRFARIEVCPLGPTIDWTY